MRVSFSFLILCLLTAIGINPASAKFENIKRIGVISAIGDTFTVQKVGITVFGNEKTQFAIGSWRIDEFVIDRIRAALGRRFDVRPVTYQKAAFFPQNRGLFGSSTSAIPDAVRAHVSPQGFDAYVVVTKAGSGYGQTNQVVNALGIVDGSGLLVANISVFALYAITVVDGRQFTVLGQASGPQPGFFVSIHGPSREVDKSWWPTALDAAHNPKLKGTITELLTQNLPQTLQKLELVK